MYKLRSQDSTCSCSFLELIKSVFTVVLVKSLWKEKIVDQRRFWLVWIGAVRRKVGDSVFLFQEFLVDHEVAVEIGS